MGGSVYCRSRLSPLIYFLGNLSKMLEVCSAEMYNLVKSNIYSSNNNHEGVLDGDGEETKDEDEEGEEEEEKDEGIS
ncbi:hypothetical protein RRG08_057591 [Elysia crispata]|uniref:Uncharacterized protein n=1 Tax=Elysia crispata TaxID=231223 RepID=A0AAE1AUV2_9GAST|nr:hypothetical protein RRG08_057591 [Elysia crispata]